jgi:hypothetical protein
VSKDRLKAVKVSLSSSPLHLALNYDESMLCVCCKIPNILSLQFAFYDLEKLYSSGVSAIASCFYYIYTQGTNSPIAVRDYRVANRNVTVNTMSWNPGHAPDHIAVCLSSGSLFLIKLTQSSAQVTAQNGEVGASCCKFDK